MPHPPILIMATEQWRFIADQFNTGQISMEMWVETAGQPLTGTWAEGIGINPDFRTWFDNPLVQKVSSVGEILPGRNQWLTYTGAHGPIDTEGDGGIGGGSPEQSPGLPASPLPTGPITFPPRIGGAMVLNPGVAGGILRIIQQAMKVVGSTVGRAGGWRAALTAIMGGLGVTQIIDIVDQWIPGLGDEEKEKLALVLEALAQLEDAGLVHPWTPRPRRDGVAAPGPFYFIFDLTQMQGHYANFHMSRAGLRKHDDRQDTPKRPRTAGRSRRSQN